MAYFAKLSFLLCLTLLCIRDSHGGYCYESFTQYYSCSITVATSTSCWLFFSCTEYRLAYETCSRTETREVCCNGYTGISCSTPICSTTCLNGGTCISPNYCSCRTGFSSPQCTDINECWTSSNKCTQTCINTSGSFRCSCHSGYQLLPDGFSCNDINECAEGTSGCEHYCTNTEGSFTCSCKEGYEMSWSWMYTEQTCQDINECSTGTSGCQQQCINTIGSFACSCNSGFQLGIDEKSCEDVNECVDGTATCDADCENSMGSFTCGCDAGFVLSGDGISCQDINECTEMNGECAQECVNEPGSYHCQCDQGFQVGTDGKTCFDIDECELGASGCSQNCSNTVGSFVCNCNAGYTLEEDERTCSGIDDCVDVICHNDGYCKDGLNSFTCFCSAGFTSALCETDVNECVIHNGGCQEICINTEGSFKCDCYEGHGLRTDGYTCSGDSDESDNVFDRHGISGGLLPKACFVLPIQQCIENTDTEMQLTSTSEWYRHSDNVFYTHGIAFVKSGSLSLPLSVDGLEVTLSEGKCRVSHGKSIVNQDKSEIVSSQDTPEDCQAYDFSESDIFEFISYGSFFSTYLFSLRYALPNWIRFDKLNDSVLAIQDLKSDLLYGNEIKESAWCSDAPVLDDHLYNVFRFDSNFLLNVLGEEIKISLSVKGKQFCIISELCHSSERTFILMAPEEAGYLLNKINVFEQLKQKYSLSVLPKGIGLSVVQNPTSEVELWNGDTMFKYSLAVADLWIGGDISIGGNLWIIDGRADLYMDVPDVNNMLTSIYLDEWNAYADAALSLSLKLRLFGKDFPIEFGKSQIETYVSIGGDQRSWCGENSSPQGIFFSVQLDISTPFEGIPLLEDWQSSIRQKAYVLSTYEPIPLPSYVDIRNHIQKLKDSTSTLLYLTTKTFRDLENIFRNTSLRLIDDMVKVVTKLNEHIESSSGATVSGNFNDIKTFLDQVWYMFSEIKDTTDLFIYDTAFIKQESFINFKDLLITEIDILSETVTQSLQNVTNTLIGMATSFTGFGFKYSAILVIKTIELGTFDLEFVYSTNSLFKCSRFDKVKEHLEGEEAFRVLGRAAKQKKLNAFFNYEKGIGVGAALSVSSDKFVFQLQIFAKLLGMKATGDLFITNNGLYLYLEGNIWDIFLAQVDVSAEMGKKWYDLTFRVVGRFLAKSREKRQIQTVNSSFQASYLDGLKHVITFITDAAKSRITQAQEDVTNTQHKFTKAQIWLEDKQNKVSQSHSAFDKAVAVLETAKEKLEAARNPFEEALQKLKEAQKNVDNLCKIKDCPSVCIPGFKVSVCHKKVWGVKIPYPCFSRTSCMIKLPDLICEAANLACRLIRVVAFLALEAAKIFVRLPLLAFDIAKTAVSAAQIIVDKSRIVLYVAEGLAELAQYGLEFAKYVLEGAKLVLEGVKIALGAVAKVLELVIDVGLKNIIDVKNCGFDVKISTRDLPVFAVFCDVNAFNLGWKTITIKINFKNILQSIWNAARATIDVLIKTFGDLIGVGRKRREIAFRSFAKLHSSVLRNVRDVGPDIAFLNESLDISYDIDGMLSSIDQDYDSRVLLFNEKCTKITVVLDFMQESFDSLLEIINESVQYINEINALKEELQQYTTGATAENMTLEDLGINTEHASNDYNITNDELDNLIEDIKMSMDNDSLLNEIKGTANFSVRNLNDALESIEAINFVETWFIAMTNLTEKYYNATECVGFKDCVFYAISVLYDIFEAEDVPDLDKIMSSILDLENVVIELFQNETHSISHISESLNAMTANVTYLAYANPFCSSAPVFLSEMKNQTVLNATKVVITCNASGDPAPQFWWLKGNEYIQGENQMNITIHSTSVEDSGVYTCTAGNVVANISSNEAYLLVITYDEDECKTNTDACEHICTNVIGSYQCSCYEGYNLNEDELTCFEKTEKTEEREEDTTVRTIVIAASAALIGSTLTAAVVFVAYTKISKAKVMPRTIQVSTQENTLFEKRSFPQGPVVEADRSFGPVKTAFNKHAFSHKVGPVNISTVSK